MRHSHVVVNATILNVDAHLLQLLRKGRRVVRLKQLQFQLQYRLHVVEAVIRAVDAHLFLDKIRHMCQQVLLHCSS